MYNKEYLSKAKEQKLSKYFTLYNVIYSTTAVNLGIDNTANANIISAATLLINKVLEPVVAHFKTLPNISSFFRCPNLNAKIGSSSTSQHCKGEAVDFTIVTHTVEEIVEYIRHNLIFDQLILERVGKAVWVHVSYSKTRNRKQVLKYDGVKYVSY